MGEDIQFKELKFYVAFKRIKNFAWIEIFPKQQKLLLYVKVNMNNVQRE